MPLILKKLPDLDASSRFYNNSFTPLPITLISYIFVCNLSACAKSSL